MLSRFPTLFEMSSTRNLRRVYASDPEYSGYTDKTTLRDIVKPRVWQNSDDYYARKTVLCDDGMTARLSLKWMPGYKGQPDLLALIVTPAKGKGEQLHIHRPPYMHISIGFRNELVGKAAEIALMKIFRRWDNKLVHCTFSRHMSGTGYFTNETSFMKCRELRYLHAMSTRYADRSLHVSM